MPLEALKSCPFCGCDDIGTESTATDGSVWCLGCRARITCKHWPRDDRGQTDAIAAWNRRTPSPEPTEAEVEAAAEVIDPNIVPLIRDYCQKKGYNEAETTEEFANSGRWSQAKETARAALIAASRSRPAEAKAGMVKDHSRYHFTDEEPFTVVTAEGKKELGRGWLAITEEEYARLSTLEPIAEPPIAVEIRTLAKAANIAMAMVQQAKDAQPAKAALEPVAEAKAEPVGVPEDWVLVPREPTEAMLDAAFGLFDARGVTTKVPSALGFEAWHAMLAAAPVSPVAQQRDDGWQDIATAPKDGTWFLGWAERPDVEDQYDIWHWDAEAETDAGYGFWINAADSNLDDYPTHWRPLPQPPALSPERKDQSKADLS